MIDNYTWASIVCRTIALLILLKIFVRQLLLWRSPASERWVKNVLIMLVVLIIANQSFTITTNFFRNMDGNLRNNVRHLSQAFNGVSALASAIGWYLLYYRDVK